MCAHVWCGVGGGGEEGGGRERERGGGGISGLFRVNYAVVAAERTLTPYPLKGESQSQKRQSH